ncbi:vasculin-like protein 1 isoform X2 [Latimeria chalumnae]|uniref:vasculin-like protein 1 isoform X2 n=1 Tax=Latimeria chalumnae TaxID=7897 RepID=UPI00313AD616
MAQHDFVPAWLNFSTPQSTKSPTAATFEKHGEHLSRGDGRFGLNRRRHNSSDGFFNNGPFRSNGDGWHQPSLFRHDSMDSGVSKGGTQVGVTGWKDGPTWHHGQARTGDGVTPRSSGAAGGGGGGGGSGGGSSGHRHWNGSFHPRKNSSFPEKQPAEPREEKKEEKEEKLQFVEEDFPSLNPEGEKQNSQSRAVGTPAGVWENRPITKQSVSKMLIIKKVSKEDPTAAFSAGFASTGLYQSNSVRSPTAGPSVYLKNLVPKSAAPPSKPGPWKPNGREAKPGLLFSGRESSFTSSVSVTKPVIQTVGVIHTSPKEPPSSTTPPIEINPSRLTKLTRRSADKKSEFLRALKDERNWEASEQRESDKLEEMDSSMAEANENGDEHCHHNGLSVSLMEESDHLSSSLEAEHRLLKAMGWQEYPENEENYLPLTEDELREFQAKSEELKKNGFGKNGYLLKNRSLTLFSPWRGTYDPGLNNDSDTETSSTSETSDDDA